MEKILTSCDSRKAKRDRLLEELRDYSPETFEHSIVTAKCTVLLAGKAGMNSAEIETAFSSALLHDIGKMQIPLKILSKPDALTYDEMEIMKTHSAKGFDILNKTGLFPDEAAVALYHHEWHNGEGYPDGIAGNEIPFLARLVSVADVFDALTSERGYRNPLPASAALDRIKNASGTQFDKDVVELVCVCREELESIKA